MFSEIFNSTLTSKPPLPGCRFDSLPSLIFRGAQPFSFGLFCIGSDDCMLACQTAFVIMISVSGIKKEARCDFHHVLPLILSRFSLSQYAVRSSTATWFLLMQPQLCFPHGVTGVLNPHKILRRDHVAVLLKLPYVVCVPKTTL